MATLYSKLQGLLGPYTLKHLELLLHSITSNLEGPSSERNCFLSKDEAVKFPDVEIGGILYSGELDESMGIDRYVVVAKDSDGCLLVVKVFKDSDDEMSPTVGLHWATKHYYSTLKECVIAAANTDLEFYGPRLTFAKQALEAAAAGRDLEIFTEGFVGD